MKKLKFLVSIVGVLGMCSFLSVSAMEKTNGGNRNRNNYYNQNYNINNNRTYTIQDFDQMYNAMRNNAAFENAFTQDINNFLNNNMVMDEQGAYYDNSLPQTIHLDNNGQEVDRDYDMYKFCDSSFETYSLYRFPQQLNYEVESNLGILAAPINVESIFGFEAEHGSTINQDGYTIRYDRNCFEKIIEELLRIANNENYTFRIMNGRVVCNQQEIKGVDLAQLINYYMYLLRYLDFLEGKEIEFTGIFENRKANAQNEDDEL